jgi:hypothetical protein
MPADGLSNFDIWQGKSFLGEGFSNDPNYPITKLLNPPLRFLQDGNLPGVIELVLRHAVQQEVKIVLLPWNPLPEAGLGQRRNRLHQHVVRVLRMSDSRVPPGLSGFGNQGKIRGAGGLDFLPAQAAASRIVPGSDVQHKFPDTVNFGQGFGCGRGGIQILQ